MNELIKLVSKKAGIPETAAKTAVETVIGFLKSKLPPAMASQVDALIAGGNLGNLGDVTQGLGGIFGKK